MNYLPIFFLIALIKQSPTPLKNISSSRMLAILRAINLLKKSGVGDLLKEKNFIDLLFSGSINPEKLFPIIAAIAPLLRDETKPSPKPSKKTGGFLPCELEELYLSVFSETKKSNP